MQAESRLKRFVQSSQPVQPMITGVNTLQPTPSCCPANKNETESSKCNACYGVFVITSMVKPLLRQPDKPICEHRICEGCFKLTATFKPTTRHTWDGFSMISVDWKNRMADDHVWVCPICKQQTT